MKKILFNHLSELTLLTLVGTTATLIGSQIEGRAGSLTNNALDRQTASPVTVLSNRSITTLSRSTTFDSNGILKTLEPSVGGENTVPAAKPLPAEPTVQPAKDQPAQATPKPANQAAAKPKPKPAVSQAAKGQTGARKQGIASWYGPGFHGRKTASGERFNSGDLTAAHRYLPFGTRVRVTNTRNGRSVVVRINDRGPFTGGRVIDLSAGAARAIGVFQSGVAPVLLEVLGR